MYCDVSGVFDPLQIGGVRLADAFPGADAGAKIAAAIADLPATGGTVDARGLDGTQTISTPVVINKPVELLLGASVFTSAGTAFDLASPGISIIGTGVDHTYIKTPSASPIITNQGNIQGSVIERLCLVGAVSGDGSYGLLDLSNANTVTIQNISTSGGIYGVHITGSWNLWMERCVIAAAVKAALFLDGGSAGENTAQSHFNNIDLSSSQGDGLLIAASGGQVDANTFRDITSEINQGIGFDLQNVSGSNSFYHCEAVDNGGEAQFLVASSENRFYYSHGERTNVASSTIYKITGSQNAFFYPRAFRGVPDGFYISGQGNDLYSPVTSQSGSNGIHMASTALRNKVYGGVLWSDPTGITEDAGANFNNYRDVDIAGANTKTALTETHGIVQIIGGPSSEPAIYDSAGNQMISHITVGTVQLNAGVATLAFSGSAAFTSASSYACLATDATAGYPVRVIQNSGESATLAGMDSDMVRYVCVGN